MASFRVYLPLFFEGYMTKSPDIDVMENLFLLC
jgi:hypothetical protein